MNSNDKFDKNKNKTLFTRWHPQWVNTVFHVSEIAKMNPNWSPGIQVLSCLSFLEWLSAQAGSKGRMTIPWVIFKCNTGLSKKINCTKHFIGRRNTHWRVAPLLHGPHQLMNWPSPQQEEHCLDDPDPFTDGTSSPWGMGKLLDSTGDQIMRWHGQSCVYSQEPEVSTKLGWTPSLGCSLENIRRAVKWCRTCG